MKAHEFDTKSQMNVPRKDAIILHHLMFIYFVTFLWRTDIGVRMEQGLHTMEEQEDN